MVHAPLRAVGLAAGQRHARGKALAQPGVKALQPLRGARQLRLWGMAGQHMGEMREPQPPRVQRPAQRGAQALAGAVAALERMRSAIAAPAGSTRCSEARWRRFASSSRRSAPARRRASVAVCSISSARTGTHFSAAPVGVGARRSAAKSISVVSVSWPMAEIERNGARRRRAHDDLLVEAPEVLERAAAARDDQHVRPRDRPARRQRVEAVDGRRDLRRAALALHAHRPHAAHGAESGRAGGAECRG